MRVAIVGGGPAGLVTLKVLLDGAQRFSTPIEPILFEAEERIGGTFEYRGYQNANLVSSKQLTSFSDFRMPLEHSDHLSLPEYVQYLERYVDRFKLRPYLRLRHRVIRVERGAGGKGHIVYVRQDGSDNVEAHEVDAISICSGLHVLPSDTTVDGIEHVAEHFHSSKYKRREQLAGKTVVVLGSGETGHDIAYEAVKAKAKEVVMCHRDGFLSFPKVLADFTVFGVDFEGHLPIDGLITNLFETSYVHPWVASTRLRWHFSDMILQRVLWFLTGTRHGCAQWVGGLPDERLGRANVFLNKSSLAMPYLNKPYKPANRFMDRIAHYKSPNTDDGLIELAPWPSHVLPSGRMIFRTTERPESKRMATKVIKPDLVVFATGYRQEFSLLDKTYPMPQEADARRICKTGDETVSFIGFVRPGVGAIPPIAEQQAMLWTLILLGKVPTPISPPHYRLLQNPSGRITYGVDHGAYMSTLARDMGAAPDVFELLRVHGLFVTFVYCFGAAFPTFYRLLGPWQSELAPEICRTELYDTIKRRGVLGNLFMGLIPMITYGLVNALALVLEQLWRHVVKPASDLAGLGLKLPFGLE